MISGLVLKYLNGECFVIRRGYETTLPVSSSFCLTGPWAQLFPAEQARIIQLLVRRVTVTAEGLVIDLRTDGIAGVMRDLMTPRQLEAAE